MLTLYHNNQPIILDNTEYYVRELASGLDEVIFDISIWDPNYALMNEEDNIVDRGGQRYLIKQIDAGAVTAKIVCQLDLDEWKATLAVGYDSGTKTVAQQISAVLPTGWSVTDRSGSSIGRTISGDLTPFEVCEKCRDTYKVYIRWDNKTKTATIYSQNIGSPVGSFATKELNLKEINYKGKSQNFATRLYAYGKDGLSFADINSGKAYVDNNTYSSRVICAYWEDDRYTDKASLLAAAQEKVAKLGVPERSYDCAIVDLQATNPELYNNLDFSLFTVATLIDDAKNTAINYQVIERHVWPYHPDHNDVIFNSEPVKIQNSVVQIEDEITNPQSTFSQIWAARVQEATDWLTNGDGYVVALQDSDGNWTDTLYMDTNDIATATDVLRVNKNGIGFSHNGVNGPYVSAWTIDGKFNADFILAGHLIADRIQGGTLESINSSTISGVTKKNFSLNMTTGAIDALKLTVDSGNFKLDASGNLTAANATLTGADVSGTVSASGMIQGYLNETELSSGALKFYKGGTLQAQISSDYMAGGVRIAATDWTGTSNQADLEVTGRVESRSLRIAWPNDILYIDSDNNEAYITAHDIYIGGDYDESDPEINIGTQHGADITIGSNYNNGSVRIVGDIDIDPNGSLMLEGSSLPSGGFYDRDGNYITVSYGMITSGI